VSKGFAPWWPRGKPGFPPPSAAIDAAHLLQKVESVRASSEGVCSTVSRVIEVAVVPDGIEKGDGEWRALVRSTRELND